MRTEPAAPEDRAPGLNPPVAPRSPWRVASVAALSGFRLKVKFRDGIEGVVDMSELIGSHEAGVFGALADVALFERVGIEFGVPTWPGDLDIAPDAIHDAIAASRSRLCKLTPGAVEPA